MLLGLAVTVSKSLPTSVAITMKIRSPCNPTPAVHFRARVQDNPALPHCVWTVAGAAPGRTEAPGYALAVMGLELDDPALNLDGHTGDIEAPPMATVADVNDAAHSAHGVISMLLGSLDDARVRMHGLRSPGGEFACVCLTVGLGDDLSIQFVATKVQQ